ncbi:MAG: dTMP kinase [Methanomassiliicoccaceae archaeon]|nr:dTMP kinase [Methanomassiliicoccaceae archaeon]
MGKGVFIVFEGIDGSGKSSCMESVASALNNANVIKTAEPTDGEIGMLIRSVTNLTAEAEALLFVADRAQHTHRIKKWIADGNIVLCDRYYASTLAYQAASLDGNKVDTEWLRTLNDMVVTEPDITFLFDIDPEISIERVESRGSKSKFECLGYLKEVRGNYLRIAKERRFIVIDASKPKEKVFGDVIGHIQKAVTQG